MMALLAPALLAGLLALAVPVLIHLIQRERRTIVQFPSLMFLQRIPYQSVRRRHVRDWLLLLLRVLALAFIVLAFARPFLRQGPFASAAAAGAREVVVLLDRSASMGYADHWQRAQTAARQAIARLGSSDRATLVLFASSAEENVRATSDRAQLDAAVNAATVGAGATRYGPALKLAQSVLARSALKRREAILISDFQKSGWQGADEVRFPEGTVLMPMSVASADTQNVAVPSVAFSSTTFSGKERVTVTAVLTNRGTQAIRDVPVSLEVDGEHVQTTSASAGPHASTTVAFPPLTLAEPNVRGSVRAGRDPLPADNVFRFVLAPAQPVRVLIVGDGTSSASLYVSKAIAISTTPVFQVEIVPVARATPASLGSAAVVILNDVPFPGGGFGAALDAFVKRGGGLLAVLGEHTTWPDTDAPLLPGRLGGVIDPAAGRNASLGFIDMSHPALEIFKAPRSGDFSSAHVFRYRALTVQPSDRVLARFDSGDVAAAERKIGSGRVIAWSTTLDGSWTDLPVRPVFLPLVHQLVRYLAHNEPAAAWYTVGQAVDLAPHLPASRSGATLVTPAGRRLPVDRGSTFVELNEQGFYEVRTSTAASGRPFTIASNLDPAESDLTTVDPDELAAAVNGHAAAEASAAGQPPTPEESEHRQALWWYLLAAGALLLVAETILSNRLRSVVS